MILMPLPRRVLAHLLAHVVAAHPRHHHVEQDEVRPELADRGSASSPVVHHPHVVAALLHQELERDHDVGLVVGDQYLLAHAPPRCRTRDPFGAGRFRSSVARAVPPGAVRDRPRPNGSANAKVAPSPGALVTHSRAAEMLDDLAADRQAESGALRLFGHRVAGLAEFLEDDLLVLGADARPVVRHRDAQRSPRSSHSSTTTRPLSGSTNLAALDSRLISTCTRRSRSACDDGTSAGSRVSSADVARAEELARGVDRILDDRLQVDFAPPAIRRGPIPAWRGRAPG